MRPTQLSVDTCGRTLHWVRSRDGRVIDWGSIELSHETGEASARAERPAALPRGAVRAALDAPGMILRRENLPAVKPAEAAKIAERRSADLLESHDEEACFAWLHAASNRPSPLWLCAAPAATTRDADERWSRRGIDVQLLASRHIALGNLVHALPPQDEDGITAILDLDPGGGTCVLSDAQGWVFSREFPLHDFTDEDPVGRDEDEVQDENDGEDGEDGQDEAERSLELEGDAPGEEASDVLAQQIFDIWPMRLATELRRTFRYVEGELGLGRVTRICVAGSSPRIHEICPLLANRLEMPALAFDESIVEGHDRGMPSGAAVALGLALWPSASGGNLLPPARIAALEHVAARRHLSVALGAVSVVLALAAGAFLFHNTNLGARVTAVASEFEAAGPARERMARHQELRARGTKLDSALAQIDDSLPALSALLTVLARATPDDVHVERLRVARAAGGWTLLLEIEASAANVAEAAQAVSSLVEDLKRTSLVELESVEQDNLPRAGAALGGRTHIRFRLVGRLAPLAVPTHVNAHPPRAESGAHA